MRSFTGRARGTRSVLALSLALVAILVATIPAAAFNAAWTKPKRVFAYSGAPTYSMVVDANGYTHIATERGSTGIWYVTNASGSWQQCQLSHGNDREPSIATANGVSHVAFARRDDGERGIYTASSNIIATANDCGVATTKRFAGSASHPSMAFYGGKLSIAFRTASKKLKFIKGAPGTHPWTINETIDGKCCTSAPSLALATNGSPRVAYGDGTSKAQGLKYAVRTSSGWKKSKASSGRIKQVSMVLDKTPGILGPPSNAPKIAYVVKKKGTYLGTKNTSFARGKWGKRWFGRHWTPPDLIFSSNLTQLVYGSRGNLFYVRLSGGIWLPTTLSATGTDVKPQIDGAVITFSRKRGNKGIYYARKK